MVKTQTRSLVDAVVAALAHGSVTWGQALAWESQTCRAPSFPLRVRWGRGVGQVPAKPWPSGTPAVRSAGRAALPGMK